MSLPETIANFANSITNIIDRKIRKHNNSHGSSSDFGHVKAGGTPRPIGTTLSAGTDNGYYARADHIHTATIANITNLQSALNDKADEEHTHSQEDVSFTGSRETWQGLGNNKNIGEALDYLMFLIEQNAFDIDKVYPVGSIYISIDDISPSTLFGGLWVKIENRFLLASGSNYPLGEMDGESSHTLSVNEMPSHSHAQNAHSHTPASGRSFMTAPSSSGWVEIQGANISGSGYHYVATSDSSNYNVYMQGSGSTTATNQNTGGNQAHNNMPPYYVVNMWKRIA